MELNFTGKGSAFYPPFKNTGAYMLSGKALYLIDCGETMFDVLYHKLDLASIEDVYVILTHMHADHVGSLGTLISYFYCLFNKAIHVVYPQETIKQLLTLEGITPLGYHYHETLPENPAGLTAVPVEVKHALDMKCYGYVLSDGTIAPLVTFVIKPVYKMLYNGNETIGQPLEKIKIACIPNGLLLTHNPNYLGKYPGLFFPGKDDKSKDARKIRARVSFDILKKIDSWRVEEIYV